MNGPGLYRAVCLAAVGAALLLAPAWAQTYPARHVRMVVPFPAGGSLDLSARLIAQRLTATLGQSVIVENIPGASGTLGTRAVAQAAADGYTLLFSGASAVVIAPLISKVDYDPLRNFAPVAQVMTSRSVLVVHPAVPVKSVPELVAYAKAHPGKLTYASAGIGTPPHLATEYLKKTAGIDMLHVPYKGSSSAMTDLIAGRVDVIFQILPVILPLARDGKVRPLAVASAARVPEFPELPTMIESGFPDFVADNWSALLAPAGTPKAIVERLNADTNAALGTPEIKAAFANAGLEPVGGTASDLARLLGEEWRRWDAMAQAAGLRGQ